jgi:hypothetical protein
MLAAKRNRLGTKLHESRATTIARQHGNWYSPLTQKTYRRERNGRRSAALLGIVVDNDNAFEHHAAVVLVLPGVAAARADRLPPSGLRFSLAVFCTIRAAPVARGSGQLSDGNEAEAHCTNDLVVWLDLPSRVYYFRGQQRSGSTPNGGYGCREEAKRAGMKATRSSQ